MKLYELTAQYLELLDMAAEADPETLQDTMEAIEGEIEDKADNYAKVIKTLEGDVSLLDAEIKRLQGKKRTIESNIARIKKNLEISMITIGKKKFKTALFSFGIQKNPAAVDVIDESAIPEDFWRSQDPVLDKRGLLDYLKANGDTDYAKIVQSESLRIR